LRITALDHRTVHRYRGGAGFVYHVRISASTILIKAFFSRTSLLAAAALSLGNSGCLGTVTDISQSPDDAGSEGSHAADLRNYVYDFRAMYSTPGSGQYGLGIGSGINLAFPLDLSTKLLRINNLTDPYPSTFIRVRDSGLCGYTGPAEKNGSVLRVALPLTTGASSAWVESISLDILAASSRYGNEESRRISKVCFGYRQTGGDWQFDFTRIFLKADAANARFTRRILVQKGPIDAVKIIFNYDQIATIQTITLAAHPMP
jgi:hypothetical protein